MAIDPNINSSEDIVAFSKAIREQSQGQAKTVVDAVEEAGLVLDPVAVRAARKIAAFIDAHGGKSAPAYHNVSHFLEVAVIALAFAREEAKKPSDFLKRHNVTLAQEDISDCFVAGLIHDLLHPGGSDRPVPFKFEKTSWSAAENILMDAGYSAARLSRLKTMLMCTDPIHGVPVIEAAMQNHVMGATLTALSEDNTFSGLQSPVTAAMAYMLTKADLALSLIPKTMLATTLRLQEERLQKESNPSKPGVRLVDDNGLPKRDGALFFLYNIAHVRSGRPFFVNGVQKIIGEAAQAALNFVNNLSQPLMTEKAARPEPGRNQQAAALNAHLN